MLVSRVRASIWWISKQGSPLTGPPLPGAVPRGHDILREYMDVTCVIYLDNILIFSENEEEHTEHAKQILAKLQEAKLYAKLSKCQFSVKKTEFLGYIIEPGGITTNPRKVQAIKEWDTP